jgi:cell division protein FtsZ
MLEIGRKKSNTAKIKIIGVGGGGCNVVNNMIREGVNQVEFITVNTERSVLESPFTNTKLIIGERITNGRGAGANPEVGREAALGHCHQISQALAGADIVFITAGMGGGTGTGAAPIFAKIAKDMGILTVGIVTKPFIFEGRKRMRRAQQGIVRLRESVDSLIVIPNQRLLAISTASVSMIDAFKIADEVLFNAIQEISDLINCTGMINLDFADIKTIMKDKGAALMGIGIGTGMHRALEAATQAISSPLLEDTQITGAAGVIVNITAGPSLIMQEVDEAIRLITAAAHEDADIIFGTVIDEKMEDRVKVSVIATGLRTLPGVEVTEESMSLRRAGNF